MSLKKFPQLKCSLSFSKLGICACITTSDISFLDYVFEKNSFFDYVFEKISFFDYVFVKISSAKMLTFIS